MISCSNDNKALVSANDYRYSTVLKLAEFRLSSKNGNYLSKIEKVINSLRSVNHGEAMIMLVDGNIVTLTDCDQKTILDTFSTADICTVFDVEFNRMVIGLNSDAYIKVLIFEILDQEHRDLVSSIRKKVEFSCRTIVPYELKCIQEIKQEKIDASTQSNLETASEIADKLFHTHFMRIQSFLLRTSHLPSLKVKKDANQQENKQIGMRSFVKHLVAFFDESKQKKTPISQVNIPTRPEFKEALESCKICFESACDLVTDSTGVDLKTRLVLVFNTFKRIIDVARFLDIFDHVKQVPLPVFTSNTTSILLKHLGTKNCKVFKDLGRTWLCNEDESLCNTILRLRENEQLQHGYFNTPIQTPTFYKRLNEEMLQSCKSISQNAFNFQSSRKYIAKEAYKAQDPREISLVSGDSVTLINDIQLDSPGKWCLVHTQDNRKGFVPRRALSRL
ncbi:hypothetical protein ACOME3_002235 [Neoechinorhynchus agilis]